MVIKPAYHVSLTAREKRLIAELAAIQSQIEWLMRITVQQLLGVTPATGRLIMASTSIAANSGIYIAVVRERVTDNAVRAWAEHGFSRMGQMAQSRNDFLHTLFGFATDGQPQGDVSFVYGHSKTHSHTMKHTPRRAVRVRGSTLAPLEDLKKLRDNAASLSLVFAHVQAETSPQPGLPRSPWLKRLGSKLPPDPPNQKVQRAKRPQVPPQSSPA